MDFAKAFDVIDHDLLLRKLALYGLSNDTPLLISSFLSNREQLVCINTIKSDFHWALARGLRHTFSVQQSECTL